MKQMNANVNKINNMHLENRKGELKKQKQTKKNR